MEKGLITLTHSTKAKKGLVKIRYFIGENKSNASRRKHFEDLMNERKEDVIEGTVSSIISPARSISCDDYIKRASLPAIRKR